MSARLVSGLCLILCACGGGGGGGSSAGGNGADPTFVPAGQRWADAVPLIKVPGRAIQANVRPTNPGRITLDRFSGPSSATLEVQTDAEGYISSKELRHRGQVVQLGPDERGVLKEAGQSDRNVAANLYDPANTRLEYSGFGVWADVPTNSATLIEHVSAGAFGTPTPANARPSGDATYFGASEGFTEVSGSVALTTSNVAVRVTDGFSRVKMDSVDTRAISDDSTSNFHPLPGHDFSASGQITNDGYAASGDGMTVHGDFYGPNAEETAGVFRGQRGGENYGGAFGAIR